VKKKTNLKFTKHKLLSEIELEAYMPQETEVGSSFLKFSLFKNSYYFVNF
jgi:hypothetical protein